MKEVILALGRACEAHRKGLQVQELKWVKMPTYQMHHRTMFQGLARSLDMGLDNMNNLSPPSPRPGPPSPVLAFSDPYTLSELQKEDIWESVPGNSSTSAVSRKRLGDWEGTLGNHSSVGSAPKKVPLNSL